MQNSPDVNVKQKTSTASLNLLKLTSKILDSAESRLEDTSLCAPGFQISLSLSPPLPPYHKSERFGNGYCARREKKRKKKIANNFRIS